MDIDTQAAFLDATPRSKIIDSIVSMRKSRDPRAPTALDKEEIVSVLKDLNFIEREKALHDTREHLHEKFGSIKGAKQHEESVEYKKARQQAG